jgi:hypothetical protein
MLSSPISAAASGPNTIVPAQTGRRIRVLGFLLSGAGAVNVTWQDGAANNLSGLLTIAGAGGTITAPIAPPLVGSELYWMIGATSQALVLNLSAAVGVGGMVVWDYI